MSATVRPLLVFVVDDGVLVADTVSSVLRSAGFEVKTFYDGSEVLLPSAPESVPDVIVTDFAMPKCDGAAVTAWVHQKFPTCRIIMISGDVEKVPAQLRTTTPHFTLLRKPVSPVRLIEEVEARTA